MIGIGHFIIGACGAVILLLWKPGLVKKLIGNLKKNDLFFVFASGFWAMIPDLPKLININQGLQKFLEGPLGNIFWGHTILDKISPDTPTAVVLPIIFVLLFLLIYYNKMKRRNELK